MPLQVIQLFTQGYDRNFSYVVFDDATRQALVVDPCGDSSLIIKVIEKQQLQLVCIVNTHTHFDHVEKNKEIQALYNCRILVHELEEQIQKFDDSFTADKKLIQTVKDGEQIFLGEEKITVIHAPGHTAGSICLFFSSKQQNNVQQDYLITGDTLFVNTIGRMDFAGGNKEQMYESLYSKIMKLADKTLLLPGHDYGLLRMDTVEGQKETNPFLKCKSKEEFVKRF